MKKTTQIAIVEDNADVRLSLRFLLKQQGYQTIEFDSPVQALDWLKDHSCDLLLLDMNFSFDTTSGEEGLYCIKQIKQLDASLPIVAMTAWANTDLVVKALKAGASDFVEKPWNNQRLLQTLNQALAIKTLTHTNQKLKQQLQDSGTLPELVCRSQSMKTLQHQLDRVASTQANVLLTGENGTGKSTLAQYIHQKNQAQSLPMVSVNMGAIPAELFESEMFGHKKGAFTGAHQDRIGKFELAQDSTLFLDEVGTLPLAQQVKLLRVLETREFEAVGDNRTQTAQLRLICASNMPMSEAVAAGDFRQDLYYRINTIEIQIPCLRQRVEDIPELVEACLARLAIEYQRSELSLSDAAMAALLTYDFPGNLRELNHILERAVLFATQSVIGLSDLNLPNQDLRSLNLPSSTLSGLDSQGVGSNALACSHSSSYQTACSAQGILDAEQPMMTLDQSEKQLLIRALILSRGNSSDAAQLLDVSRSALYRRLEKFELSTKDYQ